MIIEFNYKGKELTDKKPLALILFIERGFKFIEALNLNYVTMMQFGRIVEQINKATEIAFSEINNRFYKRFQIRGDHTNVGILSKTLYENTIKPRVLTKYPIYRTYKGNKMSNLTVIDYDFKAVTNRHLNQHIYPGKDYGLKEPKFDKSNQNLKGDRGKLDG